MCSTVGLGIAFLEHSQMRQPLTPRHLARNPKRIFIKYQHTNFVYICLCTLPSLLLLLLLLLLELLLLLV